MHSCFLITAVTIIFISCKSSDKQNPLDYQGFTEKEFHLIGTDRAWNPNDSLGTISIKIPIRLDTFYYWHHKSDCTSCGWMKYRFADKTYPQFAESGWMWFVVPDSIYQLNIWHKPIKEAPDTIVLKPLREKDTSNWFYHSHLVSDTNSVTYLLKDFKLINERPFVISAFITPDGYLTHSQTLFVIAETKLKSRELYFIGECGAKDTTGFIGNMYKSFLSIRIKENP